MHCTCYAYFDTVMQCHYLLSIYFVAAPKGPTTKVVQKSNVNPEDENEKVHHLKDKIHQELCNVWRGNNGKIGLFQFAIDPSDFGRTIENLFCISFLVNKTSDGKKKWFSNMLQFNINFTIQYR